MDSGATGSARDDVERACASIGRHLDQGAPWDACDAFREAAMRHPDDPSLLHLGALAHARAGAAGPAHALLDRAERAAGASPALRVEILSLRGRLWKDRLHGAQDPAHARRAIERAREGYLAAHAIAGDAYPAVNAATLAMLGGDAVAARALARRALGRIEATPAPSHWDHATAGEAEILLGRLDRARARYLAALAAAPGDTGAIASMRRQISLIARAMPQAKALLAILRVPDVVAFAGHRIDAADAARPRFPAELVPAVAAELRARVARLHAPIVYSSAACGADLLFLEAARDAGAEINVVLPFDRDDFVRASVATGGSEWVGRFERAIAGAARVTHATEGPHLGDDVAFEHAALLVEGLAVLRAGQLETEASMLCVLDPDAPGAIGGARQSFERWRGANGTVELVDLRALRASAGSAPRGAATRAAPTLTRRDDGGHARRTLRTMLFADVVGYSRVPDATVSAFQSRFWAIAARELAALPARPPLANTWGDALYVVFDSPRDGADFAWRLATAMGAEDWTGLGLHDPCPIRIALHAGPVFRGHDPVLGRDNYFGASVTHTARIEPVTPPGQVYASEAYAATLAAQGRGVCTLEYVGRTRLAKNYGESRVYRLERPSPDGPERAR